MRRYTDAGYLFSLFGKLVGGVGASSERRGLRIPITYAVVEPRTLSTERSGFSTVVSEILCKGHRRSSLYATHSTMFSNYMILLLTCTCSLL